MKRKIFAVLTLLAFVGFLVAACGAEKKVADKCSGAAPPAGCAKECIIGVANACDPGFYCEPSKKGVHTGKCRQACTTAGKECGDGATCSAEGRCHKSSLVFKILDFPGTKWIFLILALVMPLASILTWMERRQSAMMQDRLGPNRANIGPIKLKGILHFVADAVKMIFKEDFIPANVHKGLFALAPILAIAPVFMAFC